MLEMEPRSTWAKKKAINVVERTMKGVSCCDSSSNLSPSMNDVMSSTDVLTTGHGKKLDWSVAGCDKVDRVVLYRIDEDYDGDLGTTTVT